MISLKYGSFAVIYMDKYVVDLKEYFNTASFFIPEILFVHDEILKMEFYKSYIVKPEEDRDFQGTTLDLFFYYIKLLIFYFLIKGNKGGYVADKDFALVILISADVKNT